MTVIVDVSRRLAIRVGLKLPLTTQNHPVGRHVEPGGEWLVVGDCSWLRVGDL
jgi:hypothetical protein